ncbi:MAG: MnhB domain-containing protein [Acidimicrobiales bacterium]
MRPSLIVDVTTRVILQSAIVVSLYLLFAGHNQPGGGFIGGLVAGAGIALAYVAGGLDQVRGLLRLAPWSVIGTGLFVATVSAIVPAVLGGSVLSQDYVTFHPPVLGEVKATSALAFDSGVYLVVVGMVLMAVEALGESSPPEEVAGE